MPKDLDEAEQVPDGAVWVVESKTDDGWKFLAAFSEPYDAKDFVDNYSICYPATRIRPMLLEVAVK